MSKNLTELAYCLARTGVSRITINPDAFNLLAYEVSDMCRGMPMYDQETGSIKFVVDWRQPNSFLFMGILFQSE